MVTPPPPRGSWCGSCLSTLRSLMPFFFAILVIIVQVNIFWVTKIAPKADIGRTTVRTTNPGGMEAILARNDLNSTFSACLLVMDDNHRLVEWLAYHWFLLPLRHLVILPDSKSRTDPKEVLDRWSQYMKIEVWTDDDFMDDHLRNFVKEKQNSTSIGDGFYVHTRRQEAFYKQCALHLQEQKRTWVTFIDVDEYFVVNSDIVPDASRRMQEPGGLLNLVQEIRSLNHKKSKHYNGPCITTYRTLYGAVESTEEDRRKDVPDLLDPLRFDTLRWRYHQNYETFQHGKAFADLSLLPGLEEKAFQNGPNGKSRVSLHRFLPLCLPPIYHKSAYLRISHYLGTWEAYSFRQDRRKGGDKTREIWEEQAAFQDGGASDEIRPWVGSFFRHVGREKALELLAGAGLPPNYKNTDVESWGKAKGH